MPDPRPIPIPAGLDEGDLLAWVEGDPLPRDRQAAVTRALDADPALARLLGSMRRDRATLRDLPGEKAPDTLIGAVESTVLPALERRMLLDLEQAAVARPQVSIVQPARRSIFDLLVRDPVGRRFAAAAALLLLVGGVSYFAAGMLSGTRATRPFEGTIALNEPAPEAALLTGPSEESAAIGEAAEAPAASIAPTDAAREQDPAEPASAAGAEDRMLVAKAEAETLDTLSALELARQNRLIIRVQGRDLDRAAARVDRLAERTNRPGAGVAWRLTAETPPAVAAAVTAPRPAVLAEAPGRPEQPMLLGTRIPDDFVGPLRPSDLVLLAPVPEPRIYMVESRLDETALRGILASLSAGAEQQARFEAAAEPLPVPPPVVNAAAVLWWSQPPANWVPWTTIPVVVDR